MGCENLKNIRIPLSLNEIGAGAFYGCTKLESIEIPSNLSIIGEDAFYSCTSLEKVYINDVTKWCNIQFGDGESNPMQYADNLMLNGKKISGNLVLSSEITHIPDYSFKNSAIQSVSMPNSIKSVGQFSFANCDSLLSVTTPDSLTKIEYHAFSDCNKLSSVVIGEKVSYIGAGAFCESTGLNTIIFKDSIGWGHYPMVGGTVYDIDVTDSELMADILAGNHKGFNFDYEILNKYK